MVESPDQGQQQQAVAAAARGKDDNRTTTTTTTTTTTSIKSRQNVHPRTISPVRHVEFNLSPVFRYAKRVKESQEQEEDEEDDTSRYLGSRSSPAGSSSLGGRTALESRIYERSAVLQFQYELFGFDDNDHKEGQEEEDEEEDNNDEYSKDDHTTYSNDNNKHYNHHHLLHHHQIRLDSSLAPHHPHMSELWQPGTNNRRRSFSGSTVDEFMDKAQKEKLIERTELFKRFLHDMNQVITFEYEQNVRMEVRIHNLSFFVPYDHHQNQQGNIHTVWNQTLLYHSLQFFRRLRAVSWREVPRLFPQPAYRPILSNVNLCLKPGKMYLILGAPSSGKTTLLKAIAGLLPNPRVLAGQNKGQPRPKSPFIDGVVEYNGQTMENHTEFFLRNAISFIDQLERHASRLTVRETFEFAFQCMSGGTHRPPGYHQDIASSNSTTDSFHNMDEKRTLSQYTMEMLGLAHVADTFVGDSNVRGISGGQRRRVTVGEMLQSIPSVSIMCADEISNGLDSRSTFAIINFLSDLCRINQRTRVISLLQPSPETFSLFDEVIILAEGHIIYAGPIDRVVQYFEGLGYPLPKRMDVADYLQTVSTPDGAKLFKPSSGSPQQTHYTAQGFAKAFQSSHLGQEIMHTLQSPHPHPWLSAKSNLPLDEESNLQTRGEYHQIPLQLKIQYRNSFLRSTWLVMKRHFTLWIRDRRFVMANFIKNLVMGLSVGMVFFRTNAPAQIFGALFQSMLFIMLGAMTSAPAQIEDRIIYYKQSDANFYQTFAYTWGRFLALTPQAALDVLTFGTILYWMIGLIPTASSYFIFIAILFTFNLSMNSMFGIFASILSNKAGVQGAASIILFISTLFGGFIVAPSVIPDYYSWIYWWNPFAWAYRALVVNAFASELYLVNPEYDQPVYLNNVTVDNNQTAVTGYFTQGEIVLWSWGFENHGLPFDGAWIAYGFAYLVPYTLLCAMLIGVGLKFVRIEVRQSTAEKIAEDEATFEADSLNVPFIPVDLVFENICYEVPASTGSSTLRLLNDVTGVLKSGRMCALMGSSGAGKTTLMDVLALRKNTGTVTGQVLINGFPQEKNSFRRCSGYVEQFDVQSPELTVKETIEFSANLRNDPSNLNGMEVPQFVDSIIKMFELTSLKNAQVGTTDEGGLSFEQRKRLSIAVEFAASPSILFLDEPTTGLDSRAAMLVMQLLKRVVATGRTVCATIHQPSSAVFTMFDDLLLLKKGGEVVFHGELGSDSVNLVDYFERYGTHALEHGLNPASWMLTVLDDESKDWSSLYKSSEEHLKVQREIDALKDSAVEAKLISYETVYARTFFARNRFMNRRLNLIYWRSPVYNLGRVILGLVISFVLASVFITTRFRPKYTELEMQGRLSIIFLSFIIMGVLSMITILPTTLSIRDVYYRHHLAGMLEYTTLTVGFAVAEKPFIILVSTLFVAIFYITLGLALNLRKFGAFWGFFTFNIAIYSYFGQAFMCLVPGMATAQILCSIFIGINNFFSGLIVRPQYLSGFWALPFWLTPGHYVFEGLVASQFFSDDTLVTASPMSPFFQYLNCTLGNATFISEPCVGTVEQYVIAFFGGKYQYDHIFYDAIALGIFLVFARVLTYFALKRYNFAAT